MRIFAGLLLVVHAGLVLWAMGGFLELGLAEVPWKRFSNPLFSPTMLALQWTLIALSGVTFIVGYSTRWSRTPVVMACIYAAMAAVCAYQTFFILEHAGRFVAMAIEYVEYTVILIFLFGSRHARAHFA